MEEERKTFAVKPHATRFEDFYIRYALWEGHAPDCPSAIDADVYEVAEWREETPVFFNGGPRAPGLDPSEVEPAFNVLTKWDGCTHFRTLGFYHFDGLEGFDAMTRCVRFIYDDLCDRHNVGD